MSEPIYSAAVNVSDGRGGAARSADGHLDLPLALPGALGGDGAGTNPEQLFAAGFAACYLSALDVVARRAGASLPEVSAISEVQLHRARDGGFDLAVEIVVRLPARAVESVRPLLARTEHICPYSRATHGNIQIRISAAEG